MYRILRYPGQSNRKGILYYGSRTSDDGSIRHVESYIPEFPAKFQWSGDEIWVSSVLDRIMNSPNNKTTREMFWKEFQISRQIPNMPKIFTRCYNYEFDELKKLGLGIENI